MCNPGLAECKSRAFQVAFTTLEAFREINVQSSNLLVIWL